jgi:hypothetical protein
MQFHTVLLIVVLALITLFTALNWGTFIAPTALSLGFTTVTAPLGLIMLGLLVLLTVLFLIFLVYLQTSVLLESRRHNRELREQRQLADQAEASRFTELRGYVEGELGKLTARGEEASARVLARIDQAEQQVRSDVEQSGTTLAAYIGELEDRIERSAAQPPTER